MSKRLQILIVMLTIGPITVSCQPCIMDGQWIIRGGQITRNYERSFKGYSQNKIKFLKDSVELTSGFYYNILDVNADNYALGRFPFVYYGKKEKYKVVDDSVFIYSGPYKHWDSFKISCIREGQVKLVGKGDSLTLIKINPIFTKKDCSIKYITAHVFEVGLGLYDINYRVTLSSDDILLYEELREISVRSKTIQLKPGAFKEICQGFNTIDLLGLKEKYRTEQSEMTVVELEIGLVNGSSIRTILENDNYPEDLYFALVPILYGHQKFIYRELPPVDWE